MYTKKKILNLIIISLIASLFSACAPIKHIEKSKLDEIDNYIDENSEKEIVLDTRESVYATFSESPEHIKTYYLNDDINKVLKDIENIDFEALSGKYKNKRITTKGINLYYDKNGELIKDLRDRLSYDKYIVAVNRKQYTATIYGYDLIDNQIIYTPIYTIPCAVNKKNTRIGMFLTTSKFEWHTMVNGDIAQYCIRFDENRLFHSPLYETPKKNRLIPKYYNDIVRKHDSGGCVRMRTGDAYYLYKTLPHKTLVVVYETDHAYPFGREEFEELPEPKKGATMSELYDPTDPVVTGKW